MSESVTGGDSILFLGNPLLDSMIEGSSSALSTYSLNPDSEPFAHSRGEHQPGHLKFLQWLDGQSGVPKIPGGASQNSARVTSYLSSLFGEKLQVTFTGAVGKDDNAAILKKSVEEAGVTTLYQEVDDGTPTGECGAFFFNDNVSVKDGQVKSGRTLVTTLGAAGKFKDSLFPDETLKDYKMFYAEGFFITTSMDTLRAVAMHARKYNKEFMLNISSIFTVQSNFNELVELIPYATVIFGNENEFKALWEANSAKGNKLGLDIPMVAVTQEASAVPQKKSRTFSLRGKSTAVPAAAPTAFRDNWTYETFAQAIGNMGNRKRTVVVTMGTDPAVLFDRKTESVAKYEIFNLNDKSLFKDTNAAGDSYVAGFISAYAANKPMDQVMQRAAFGAGIIVQSRGCSLPDNKELDKLARNLEGVPLEFLQKIPGSPTAAA